MKAEVFEYQGEGIECVYNNGQWVVCIKNWKPNNDIGEIRYLEVHHETDEQFILVQGKAVLLTASRKNNEFQISLTLMEPGKVYNVPQEQNSTYCDMTAEELEMVRKEAAVLLHK